MIRNRKPKIDRDSVKTWSEIAKNVVSIAAVFVAAYWSYYIFAKKDEPTLQPRAKSTYSLKWNNAGDVCKANLRVDLENTGASDFNISKVRVQGWNFEKNDQSSGSPVYFELNDVRRKGPTFFDATYDDSNPITFVGHFPPQSGTGHNFEWSFQRQPNRWVYFQVDMYRPEDLNKAATFIGTWDQICGQ